VSAPLGGCRVAGLPADASCAVLGSARADPTRDAYPVRTDPMHPFRWVPSNGGFRLNRGVDCEAGAGADQGTGEGGAGDGEGEGGEA